jgi:YfiH family protein
MSVPMEIITDESLAENGFAWRESREKNGVKVLVCEPLENAGFVNGFSTRAGGVSAFPENALSLSGFDDDTAENIQENRRRFIDVFGGRWQLASCWQIHSDIVRTVYTDDEAKDGDQKCDGVISDLTGVLAGVKTADCVPVLIGDMRTKAYAAVHAGWRGTSVSIVTKALEKMYQAFGTRPEETVAAIGPAALGCCYEVGSDVIEIFRSNFSYANAIFTPTRENHALIDLHLANKKQLMDSGVRETNIYLAPLCTMQRTDLFFSYRVESKTAGKTGRLMSVIGRNE